MNRRRNRTVEACKEISVIICVILLISCIPVLIQTQSFAYFFRSIGIGIYYLFQPHKVLIPLSNGDEVPFFAVVYNGYLNSIVIIFGALAVAIIVSILLTYLFHILSPPFKKAFSGVFFIVESMPDVLIVILNIQFFIWIFKTTGISLGIYEFGGETIYLLPILALSSIPAMYLFKYMTASIDEEKNKKYYLFSQSRGFGESYIFFIHLFRNTLLTLIQYYKTIFLYMISSLLIFEILLRLNGIMSFVRVYGIGDFRIMMWILIMLYIPLYIFIRTGEFIVSKWTREEAGDQIAG
ncbi:ABC transporter permease subunit [Oceanobacillus massiliensis]|uniref:ABC transporter permease subunit n=1 Tax=Oceanobacillus massiliensis TaxID=1465765 RepID=UPI000287C67F|nr:ABC transporter permease subunit [Oceanobacillus massiliensis]